MWQKALRRIESRRRCGGLSRRYLTPDRHLSTKTRRESFLPCNNDAEPLGEASRERGRPPGHGSDFVEHDVVEEDGFEDGGDGLLAVFGALAEEEDDPGGEGCLEVVVSSRNPHHTDSMSHS